MRHAKTTPTHSGASGARPHRARRILGTLMIAAGLALLVAAGFTWGKAQWRYHKQDQINRKLASYVTLYDAPSNAPKPPDVDWAGLKAVNTDVVAWLQVPGTAVNYPVYQAEDNVRYLRSSVTGEYAVGGQLFNDYACTRPGMVDALTLTYGHHMLDGSMFKEIAEMDQQEAFDAVDTVWYVTEQTPWELEPLLLYYTTPDDEDVRTFTWDNDELFRTYLQGLLAKAVVCRPDAAQVIAGTKHVLALITCNYYEGYGRTVLLCVPKYEAAAALS